jgi:hypothetical protein
MAFKKAVKSQSKLRAAMFGPSGAGKTYSALAIASGMGGKIALIDSERSSASLYADRFNFDQVDLVEKTVDEYVRYIDEAAAAGYDVLIIDSLSHAWEILNEEVQQIADAMFRGNFWSAWSKGTPRQRKLINAIVGFPGHIIATMRSKTEWQTGSGSDGKKSGPVRVGLAPEQGKGIEYEFTILFELSTEHLAHIIKDRTGKFQDKIIEKPGKEFGQQLVAWLNEGAAPPPPPSPPPEIIVRQCHDEMVEIGNILNGTSPSGERYFTNDEYDAVKATLKSIVALPLESRLAAIGKLLREQKALLVERAELFDRTGAGEKPGEEVPGVAAPPDPAEVPPPEARNTPEVPSMYQEKEPEEETREAAGDGGFANDIPWDNPPSKKAAPSTEHSLLEGFQDYLSNKSGKPEAAQAEPGIF